MKCEMLIEHRLVGYDPETEKVACAFVVPEARMPEIIKHVGVDADDPEAYDVYPLTVEQAVWVGEFCNEHDLKWPAVYFLECSDVTPR